MTLRLSAMQMLSPALAPLGYPISWEGVNFTPPASGYWLVVTMMPNEGEQPGLPNDSEYLPEGLIQVEAFTRPGTGVIGLDAVAQEVIDALPAGASIEGSVRIARIPRRTGGPLTEGDRISIAVTAEYGV